MQKKIKVLKKISLVILLIITILISTMPYKPKILDSIYNAKTTSFEAIQMASNKSNITINKVDSKTEEPLEGVNFELTPIEENIIDNIMQVKKYTVRYWSSNRIIESQTYYGESDVTIIDCNLNNLKGWAIEEDSNEVVFLPEDTMYVNQDIDLYAVNYKLEYFKKDLVMFESELPDNIPSILSTITYIEDKRKVEFINENSQITLLYKLTARGDPGLRYEIQDSGAEYAFGDTLNGIIPSTGEINCYVTKSFSPSDINFDGNLENTARITPGTNNNSASSSTKIVPAADNTPSYTVTYIDGTSDGSVFGEKVFSGIKFGEKTPEFTGNLERDGYEFQGWAPAICEKVEYDSIYMATWLKRAELIVIISPNKLKANVGDTVQWSVEIKNSNWADTSNVKLETTLNNGKVIFTKENIVINAGESFKTTVEYVVSEEDAGKTLKNVARVTDFANNWGTAKPITCSGSHSSGVDILSEESALDIASSVSQTPSLLNSFNNERIAITNQNITDYTFIKNENGIYKSNNQGIANSEACSYIPIDLSNYIGNYVVEVNSSISSERGYDYGYARLIEQEDNKINFDNILTEFINVSGTVENKDYKVILEGGKKYIILFGYVKDSIVDDGEDTFSINSVRLIFNSEGLKEKITLQTDGNGIIVTEIPDGKYILTETNTIEGYKLLEYPIIIEVHNNEIKILENKNLDSITVLNNNELKIENTTSRVIVHYYLKTNEGGHTETKLKEDKIIKGIEGTKYKTDPDFLIEKDGIIYELEYEIEDGIKKYITPENDSGNFGKEDINVNYYYKAKKQIIVNKTWGDNNDSLGIRPEFITVTLTAKVKNEDGDIEEYLISNVETKVELNSLNNWTYSWTNLETYDKNGKEIMYYIEEINIPEEYYSVISQIDNENYNITNYKYGSIKVIKVDGNNNLKLGGAEFKLEKILEENGQINIDENFKPIILITSTEEENLGEAIFEKLEYGTYRLTETKAPNGYSLQNKAIDIEITEENPDFVGNVINKPKTVLPNTGGNGSVILTMLGVFCIAIAIKIKK